MRWSSVYISLVMGIFEGRVSSVLGRKGGEVLAGGSDVQCGL